MSVPIPYQPPSVQQRIVRSVANVPARKASTLLLLIGVFFAGLGLLAFGLSKAISTVTLPEDTKAQIHQIELQSHMPFDLFLRRTYRVLWVEAAVTGLLGLWVRRGKRLSFYVAMGLIGLEMASMLVSLVALLPQVAGGGPQALGSIASCLIAIALGGFLFTWLMQAIHLSRQAVVVQPAVESIEPLVTTLPQGLGYGPYVAPPPPRRDD